MNDNDDTQCWNAETVPLKWSGDPPTNEKAVEALVRADMALSLDGLSYPSDLMFHCVLLGNKW